MATARAERSFQRRIRNGRSFACAVFMPAKLDHLREVRTAFISGSPVEVRLCDVPPADRRAVVDYLESLVGAADGELSTTGESVLLLFPHDGAPEWRRPDDDDGLSGVRQPRTPVAPAELIATELELPDVQN